MEVDLKLSKSHSNINTVTTHDYRLNLDNYIGQVVVLNANSYKIVPIHYVSAQLSIINNIVCIKFEEDGLVVTFKHNVSKCATRGQTDPQFLFEKIAPPKNVHVKVEYSTTTTAEQYIPPLQYQPQVPFLAQPLMFNNQLEPIIEEEEEPFLSKISCV